MFQNKFVFNDVFRINIPITETAVHEYAEENGLTEREITIFKMIKANNKLTVEEVMAVLDISRATVFRDYAKIRKKCTIFFYGSKEKLPELSIKGTLQTAIGRWRDAW